MITILSADDVRRQVMEPWCPVHQCITSLCPDEIEHGFRPALFTRCPGCQPESLYWGEPGEDDHGGRYKGSWILRQRETKVWIAIDLILMSIARDGKKAFIAPPQAIQQKYYDCLVDAVVATDLPGAVAARHRLKDLEEQT